MAAKRPRARNAWSWRSRAFRGLVYQVVAAATIAALAWFLWSNTLHNMRVRGIQSGFDFLGQQAGFTIGESLFPFDSAESYLKGFAVGLSNTLRVAVAGVTDYSAHHFDPAHRSDPHAAAHGAPEDAVKVLLAHQPRSATVAAEAGYHLQLSGHTHGGQFWPWNLFVPLQQPFTAGLNRLGLMWVYINRGTGYWGPPMRFGIPSEITLIRLERDAAAN